jgi:uncharacterized damage-inducible protein DinB
MAEVELIILNLEEIRRRSIILWQGLPPEFYFWKPDAAAMHAIEMIRHVVCADYGWNIIIKNNGDLSTYKPTWTGREYISVADELEFAKPFREEFLQTIRQFSAADLSNIEIIHPGNGQKRKLGDYLLRIGYHEAVHAGQFLSYMRAMGIERPSVWD